MQSKIMIRFGSFEMNYTGSELFIKKEIPEILNSISKLLNEIEPASLATLETMKKSENLINAHNNRMNNFAFQLGVSSCTDLILASCIYLEHCHKLEKYNRREILKEMRNAQALFKPNYSNNLTNSLASLEKAGYIYEVERGVYRLTDVKRKELEALLQLQEQQIESEQNEMATNKQEKTF